MNRNPFILRALEREIAGDAEWSPGFLDKFTPLSVEDARTLDKTLTAVRLYRKNKEPPAL